MTGQTDFYCVDYSLAAGEMGRGTAARADYWLALEYPGPHGVKALEESMIPDAVKVHLKKVLAEQKHSRLQLIKQGPRFSGNGIAFFVAVSHEEVPNLYQFQLSSYDDLLSLDFHGIFTEQREFWSFDRKDPIYLVCTNGKHDRCCSRYGLPVYQVLKAAVKAPDQVWQASHTGGHRFAPNVVTLPHGATYGHIQIEEAGTLLEAQEAKVVYLPKYRGRACYDPHVQAAEMYLRERTGTLDLGAFKLLEIETISADEWVFHFHGLQNADTHCIQMRRQLSDFPVYKSCGDSAPVRMPEYTLLDYQTRPALGRL